MTESKEPFEGWAILELMGHRRLAGYVSEVELAGAGMLRLDIPAVGDGADENMATTQFYSPSSLYCLTPTTEEVARRAAYLSMPRPVSRWELEQPERDTDDSAGYEEESF